MQTGAFRILHEADPVRRPHECDLTCVDELAPGSIVVCDNCGQHWLRNTTNPASPGSSELHRRVMVGYCYDRISERRARRIVRKAERKKS